MSAQNLELWVERYFWPILDRLNDGNTDAAKTIWKYLKKEQKEAFKKWFPKDSSFVTDTARQGFILLK